MSGRSLFAATALAAMLAASPAVAQQQDQQPQTITATGTWQIRVVPKNGHSNGSIAAAVDAARKASSHGALDEAHEYAVQYAGAVGLTLGSVISVSDAPSNGYFIGGGGASIGTFGPNQYCGTVQQLVGKRVKGKKPRFRKVHRCIVPRFAYTTLTVTYSAR